MDLVIRPFFPLILMGSSKGKDILFFAIFFLFYSCLFNSAPNIIINIFPIDNSKVFSDSVQLKWKLDRYAPAVAYDLYLGNIPTNLNLVEENILKRVLDPYKKMFSGDWLPDPSKLPELFADH